MRLRIRRRRPAPEPQRLLELIVPGRNESGISAAEGLLGALALQRPFALEIAGNHLSPWLSARTTGEALFRQLKRQLGARYGQVRWREMLPADDPEADPALLRPGEQMAACVLDLRGPEYLPLRMWTDRDLGDDARGQAGDPILAVLAAVRHVPPGWRALAQLLLLPAPADWSGKHRSRLQPPRHADGSAYDVNLQPVFLGMTAIMAVVLAGTGMHWYADQDWPHAAGAAAGLLGCGAGALGILRFMAPDVPADPELVRQKITLPGFRAQLRLAVYAPLDAPAAELRDELQQLAGAYGHYNLAIGNGLSPRLLKGLTDLRRLEPIGKPKVLNVSELAGLWHLPHGAADVPLLERTSYRRILPGPDQVRAGCRVGLSVHQDIRIP
ncbi:MAG TPA: hypothetical protein VK009_26660, partial [Chloroflexota bacterium]|nr:hypothetical protein [Chloroflexota bacterium]